VLLLLLLQAAGKDFNPIWIFHGSAPENIPKIMEEGFRVGGKQYPKSQHWQGGKFPVKNGAVHGEGVYSATGPNTPMAYSHSQNSSGQIILVRFCPVVRLGAPPSFAHAFLISTWNGVCLYMVTPGDGPER
jgi:hypothetical protein